MTKNKDSNLNISVPVSPGELIDKLTILEIKSRRIKNNQKLKTIRYELNLLKAILNRLLSENKSISEKVNTSRKKLLEINKKLWDIENQIREKESSGTFDNKFISLARAVYITNDKRSEIKNKINTLFGAAIKEIKEYSGY